MQPHAYATKTIFVGQVASGGSIVANKVRILGCRRSKWPTNRPEPFVTQENNKWTATSPGPKIESFSISMPCLMICSCRIPHCDSNGCFQAWGNPCEIRNWEHTLFEDIVDALLQLWEPLPSQPTLQFANQQLRMTHQFGSYFLCTKSFNNRICVSVGASMLPNLPMLK